MKNPKPRRILHSSNALVSLVFFSFAVLGPGCTKGTQRVPETEAAPLPIVDRSLTQQLGTYFGDLKSENLELSVKRIPIPKFPGTFAIWGGTGRDDAGNIFLGVSTVWTREAPQPSARLFCYQPNDGRLVGLGDVVGQLQEKKLAREEMHRLQGGRIVSDSQQGEETLCRESQMKIHSKLVAMDDGWTYFASMDEWNEREDGSQLPHWGSHFWRFRRSDDRWEHLKSVPEGIIAVSGAGRYLFALGYFGHVVYRLDTKTGNWKRAEVGSVGGHISRNLASDLRGHAFVPRISNGPGKDSNTKTAELVELDENLEEIGSTGLEHYPITEGSDSHGITGTCFLADGSLAIVTSSGHIYHLDNSRSEVPTVVKSLGWIHPNGHSRTESLFCMDGKQRLFAISHTKESGYEAVIFDLKTNSSTAYPLDLGQPPAHGMRDVALYGCNTRDDNGAYYVVGRYKTEDKTRAFPLCLKIEWREKD